MFFTYNNAINFFLCVAIFIVYILPSIVACMRKHHKLGKIITLNILLGWTIVFWVISLCLSLSKNKVVNADIVKEQDLLDITDHTPHKHWIE